MGRKVDVDDLLDANQLAEMLGLASSRVVAVYAARNLPAPVIDRGSTRAKFWVRQDIEHWLSQRTVRGARSI